MKHFNARALVVFALVFVCFRVSPLHGEAMIQYFNTSWDEIAMKMPELAEAGYDSIWIPPPTKAGGGLSVGYDLFDSFDLGSKDQRGSVSTRYGTQADLINMITIAHRFGIRIYLDNVMNHRGFDIPGYNASTPIDIYPGMLPEDFHLQVTQDGFYRNWPGISNYSDQWQVWNLSTSNLVDVAQEPGTTNLNFGLTEGSTHPKISFVRNPNNPEYYCFDANGNYVGFGGLLNLAPNPLPAGFATAHDWAVNYIATHSSAYTEYVQDYLNRNARWLIDQTKADGLRLDAIKHVRYDFFGASFGSDKDYSDYGYLGQAQRQFNLTRGFNDPKFNNGSGDSTTQSDLRETVFDTERPRHNLMFFGEHLGGTAQQPYIDAGSRLLDNNLQSALINELPFGPLNGLDQPGGGGLPGGPGISVGYAQSADNGYMPKIQLAHAFLLARAGLSLIYTDGNHHAGVLGQISKAFPANANTNYLGQYSDGRVPNMLYIHNQFARGNQIPKWSDGSFVAFERQDKRENTTMTDADGTTMLFMMNGNSAAGQSRGVTTTFPAGSYLWQYAAGPADNGDSMAGFYYTVPNNQVVGDLIVPKGGYFALSWRNPEESDLWSQGGGKPITVLQNGQPAGTFTYLRKDGPDGDPNFNPYNVTGAVAGSYAYPYTVPRVTNGSSLSFIARTDGSAENILMELDGGIDLNGNAPANNADPIGKRDNPPGISTDVFLGYEQPLFVERQYPEKFAAKDTTNDTIGSSGADTYDTSTNPVTDVSSHLGGNSSFDTQGGTVASFVFQNPDAQVDAPSSGSALGPLPSTQYANAGSELRFWAKTNPVGAGLRIFVYYTTDGSNPEGAGPTGIGTTQVSEMHYSHNGASDGDNWWYGTITPAPAGSIKYKIGIYKSSSGGLPVSSVFPGGAAAVAQKKKMMTTFQVNNFNATTATVYPHNDYGVTQTGLSEGFHVLRVRSFLKRDGTSQGNGLRASIYNTFTQVFYYDAQPPQGEIDFPAHDGDGVGGQQYGVVVRTDPSVTEVWYKIVDSDPNNDDTVTLLPNGNGAWVKATQLTANLAINSPYPNEWRFNYVNIPATGTGQIYVRLRELSSADSTQFTDTPTAADDQAKHYTTLTRNVNTNGPLIKMFVAFPPSDGQVVDNNYILKTWFSKSLGNGVATADLIKRFVITISSSESGSAENPVVQGQAGYSINYNVDGPSGQYDELAYQLPNLYNGQPDFLHTITVTYTQTGAETLTATRLVKAKPVVVVQDNILSPPEFDADGAVYQIVLPDVANPTAAQRTVPITVQTDATATGVTISFTQGNVPPANITSTGTSTNGSNMLWNFNWTNVQAGDYQFSAAVTTPNGNATATRDAHVVLKQIVTTTKGDSDDDGLSDVIETTPTALPTTSSDGWTNDQVHLFKISGLTDPMSPDTDNDGLPDGLELGWGAPVGDTNPTTDTNGDGVPNFLPDLDPPIYNTTDNSSPPAGQDYSYFSPWPYNYNNSRTDQIAGSVTDPNKPDTDDDGLLDGVEDRTYAVTLDSNQNPISYRMIHTGRVEILPNGVDGEAVIAHPPTVYNTSMVDRSKVLAKSPNAVWLDTDPNNSDTDNDGAPDGQEDLNHNGIVDLAIIDRNQTDSQGNFVVLATLDDFKKSLTVTGSKAGSQPATFYYSKFCYTYTEPTNSQTYTSTCLSKDKLNATFRPSGQVRSDSLDVIWLETDPRRFSTTGDGLPDGWKIKYGLDPFDDGVVGDYNLHTGKVITNTNNGPTGSLSGDGVNNQQHFINGTDPRVSKNAQPPPPGAITIGPGTPTTVGAVVNNHEFTDWTAADLIALDYYDGDGINFNASDIYHAYDGWDTSRDMVAFYAHDGGDPNAVNPSTGQHGDGNFYFRIDFEDLQAYAEQGYLDMYVVINFGNPGTGEYNLPDQVDTGTTMKWQAVVACYQSNVGTVYLWNKNSATHSTAIGQDLSTFGVTARNQNTANGFGKAYFNSDIDAVEFSISRQALLDAGWDGADATRLIYQVYTTKDGTQDSPSPGPGDIGGRSDIRDSIRNDWIASDYYLDQQNIDGANSVLRSWVGLQADNDNGKRVKVVSIIHGNQAIQPGSVTQSLINNTQGAGYYRPLDAHQAYNVPLTMHITPTLASGIQWAKADPNSMHPYRDGPALNARIASMIQAGTVDLLGTTFSDHMLDYFPSTYNIDNIGLANDFLTKIYGAAPSNKVFWTAERVSDSGVLQKVSDLGFQYTFVDQMRHIFKWFGRSSALGDDGYRINQINNTKAFVVNDGASTYLLQNDDNGLPILMRQLLNRKARDGQQDQVVVFVNQWEDFATKANADAYDKNIRWLANHPWIQIVTPDQIASNQIDTSVPPNGSGTQWGSVNRGTGLSLPNVAKDFIDHADEENYDHWYFGSSIEESLSTKVFNIRTGVAMPTAYGLLGSTGIANTSWQSLNGIVPGPTNIGLFSLGRATWHASEFETAFHDQTANDLSKFSTGAYIYPDTGFQSLSGFSKFAQSQTREAAVYARVNTWAQAANNGAYFNSVAASSEDVDLDGENEYLIYNDRLFALFESGGPSSPAKSLGGRLIGAWLRDIDSGYVAQVAGNFASYSGSETEEEGAGNFSSGAVNAFRTSGFKDWFAKTDNTGNGTFQYVNDYYSVTPAPSGVGWKFTSSDGKITKTITLAPSKSALQASYTTTGFVQLFVRSGLSPDLLDLLTAGQSHLGNLISSSSEVDLFNNNSGRTVRDYMRFGGTGYSGALFNATANDSDANVLDTVAMRDQAQTQQVEMQGNGTMNFALGFETGAALTYDSDGDGIPDWWTQKYFGHPTGQAGDLSRAGDNPAGDGLTNLQKYILGLSPLSADSALSELKIARTSSSTVTLTFSTIHDRMYQILYSNSLTGSWLPAGNAMLGTASTMNYIDNGNDTGSPPTVGQKRFYKLQVSLLP
jgi:Alpha amylase, catalytic domain/Glycosyl hydrolase family 57